MLIATLLTFVLSQTPALQDTEVAVRVRMPDGKPAVGVKIDRFWLASGPRFDGEFRSEQNNKTDAEGIAKIKLAFQEYDIPVIARMDGTNLGGYVAINPKKLDGVEIALKPMRQVAYQTTLEPGTTLADDATLTIFTVVPTAKGSMATMSYGCRLAMKGEIALPPGKYRFMPSSKQAKGREQWLEVSAGEGTFKLPPFEFAQTALGKSQGKMALPLAIAGTTQPSKPIDLAKYRGKWVLLDFWGYWCQPCVAGMPKLIDFYREHANQRDKFEILAIHDSTAKTMAELQTQLKKLETERWRQPLPFPVLLDKDGATVKAWEIIAFPTQVLIDPEGRIVPNGKLETLAAALKS